MNIGLVLAGGVAKGAYQAGFLKALGEESNINVTSISGASIGVLGAYAYSAGKIDLLNQLWRGVHFDSLFDLAWQVWFKHYLRDKVKELVSPSDELRIPVYSPVCYLPFLHMDYCRMQGGYQQKWYKFLRSAISFPLISGGIRFFRGQISVDGGLMDNIPIQPILYNQSLDIILVLHFEAGFRPRRRYLQENVPIIDYDVSINNLFRKRSFDFHGDTLTSMLESGYAYGKQICEELFNHGKNTIEDLLAAAEKRRNDEFSLRMDNVTFETWVQRANNLFYPLIVSEAHNVYDVVDRKKCNKQIKKSVNSVKHLQSDSVSVCTTVVDEAESRLIDADL